MHRLLGMGLVSQSIYFETVYTHFNIRYIIYHITLSELLNHFHCCWDHTERHTNSPFLICCGFRHCLELGTVYRTTVVVVVVVVGGGGGGGGGGGAVVAVVAAAAAAAAVVRFSNVRPKTGH